MTYQQIITRGDELFEQGQHGHSIQAYAQAAQMEPEKKEALVKLGLAYRDLGDAAGAIAFFEKAATLDDQDAFIHFNLGLAQYGEGQMEAAAGHIEKAAVLVEAGVASARVEAEAMSEAQRGLLLTQCDELAATAADARALLEEIATAEA